MAKDFAKASKHGEDLGLNFDELAFYDALAENKSALIKWVTTYSRSLLRN